MSRQIAQLIAKEFSLGNQGQVIMEKNIKSLDKKERLFYFQRIRPVEKEIKKYLYGYYNGGSELFRELVILDTVNSLLAKKGDPDLSDGMIMNIIGRMKVYNQLRQRSESEGIRLSALTNFGGLSMVIMIVVAVTAVILYIINM